MLEAELSSVVGGEQLHQTRHGLYDSGQSVGEGRNVLVEAETRGTRNAEKGEGPVTVPPGPSPRDAVGTSHDSFSATRSACT